MPWVGGTSPDTSQQLPPAVASNSAQLPLKQRSAVQLSELRKCPGSCRAGLLSREFQDGFTKVTAKFDISKPGHRRRDTQHQVKPELCG